MFCDLPLKTRIKVIEFKDGEVLKSVQKVLAMRGVSNFDKLHAIEYIIGPWDHLEYHLKTNFTYISNKRLVRLLVKIIRYLQRINNLSTKSMLKKLTTS